MSPTPIYGHGRLAHWWLDNNRRLNGYSFVEFIIDDFGNSVGLSWEQTEQRELFFYSDRKDWLD